ncbi:MAG: hypothetical protein JSS56_20765 [Proteobacteria bacterium]|nr:hypothetical protein [Pseudomonadota bacterium]
MDSPLATVPDNIWIAACAHELAKRWRTVDPKELEAVARELAHDHHLREMPPTEAAADWLRPLSRN